MDLHPSFLTLSPCTTNGGDKVVNNGTLHSNENSAQRIKSFIWDLWGENFIFRATFLCSADTTSPKPYKTLLLLPILCICDVTDNSVTWHLLLLSRKQCFYDDLCHVLIRLHSHSPPSVPCPSHGLVFLPWENQFQVHSVRGRQENTTIKNPLPTMHVSNVSQCLKWSAHWYGEVSPNPHSSWRQQRPFKIVFNRFFRCFVGALIYCRTSPNIALHFTCLLLAVAWRQ